MNKRVISINIDDELLKKLEDYQYTKRINRSEVIRQALINLFKLEGI